jgi:hypothetical protein
MEELQELIGIVSLPAVMGGLVLIAFVVGLLIGRSQEQEAQGCSSRLIQSQGAAIVALCKRQMAQGRAEVARRIN